MPCRASCIGVQAIHPHYTTEQTMNTWRDLQVQEPDQHTTTIRATVSYIHTTQITVVNGQSALPPVLFNHQHPDTFFSALLAAARAHIFVEAKYRWKSFQVLKREKT
jgi:hypothetical protein